MCVLLCKKISYFLKQVVLLIIAAMSLDIIFYFVIFTAYFCLNSKTIAVIAINCSVCIIIVFA